jgi:hypothetical protein
MQNSTAELNDEMGNMNSYSNFLARSDTVLLRKFLSQVSLLSHCLRQMEMNGVSTLMGFAVVDLGLAGRVCNSLSVHRLTFA